MIGYSTNELLALALAVSFAAGLNVYAVIATLGLLARADMIALPGALTMIESWWVIGASLALYGIEFVADKVPLLDLVWNVLQLFVRVPVAAILAFAATERLPVELQITAAIAGSALAFVASSVKIGLRGAANSSPEPFSNVVLSLVEDAIAIGVTWFATEYPWLAASIVLFFVVVAAILARLIFAGLRAFFRRVRGAT